jgi:hypothetical protein
VDTIPVGVFIDEQGERPPPVILYHIDFVFHFNVKIRSTSGGLNASGSCFVGIGN